MSETENPDSIEFPDADGRVVLVMRYNPLRFEVQPGFSLDNASALFLLRCERVAGPHYAEVNQKLKSAAAYVVAGYHNGTLTDEKIKALEALTT